MNDNLFVKLIDRRARVVWVGGHDASPWDRPILEYIDQEHRALAEGLFADCILRGQQVEFFARWHLPINKLNAWCWTHVYPVDPEVARSPFAAVLVQRILPGNFDQFTEGDKELLGMLAEDRTVKEVAALLDRSESAIDLRIRNLKAKLDAHTLHGLVASAARGHLIPLPMPPIGRPAGAA